MTIGQPITVALDRARVVRWTHRAQARMGSLPRPASFGDLAKPRHQLYAVCAVIWAALVDKDHGFDAPEDIAEYLATGEQQVAALKAITAMIEEAFPPAAEKKSEEGGTSSSSNGRLASSTSGSELRTSVIGT